MQVLGRWGGAKPPPPTPPQTLLMIQRIRRAVRLCAI